jgi:hypothetical protein
MSMNSSAFTESHQAANAPPSQTNKLHGENINEQYLMRNASKNKKVSFPDERHSKNINDNINRQEEELSENENDQSFASVTTTTSSIIDDKVIKRKISRYI